MIGDLLIFDGEGIEHQFDASAFAKFLIIDYPDKKLFKIEGVDFHAKSFPPGDGYYLSINDICTILETGRYKYYKYIKGSKLARKIFL